MTTTSQGWLQKFRELCGGHGYSHYNKLGIFRDNNDVNQTWEGDNTVIIQQTAKFILDNFQSVILKGKKNEYKVFYIL